MTQEEFMNLMDKLEANELYRNSRSVHKGFQFRQFFDNATGKLMEGQQVRMEDKYGCIPEDENYDADSERTVIYNFREGVLQSDNGEPAVQYPGHYEIWNMGLLEKVWADGGNVIEYWKDGIPYKVENSSR